MSQAVALDATLFDEPTTGIGLYTHELVRALRATGERVDCWGARTSGELPRRRLGRTAWTLTRLPTLLSEQRPRAYHALSNFNLPLQPVDGVPFVLTVHDLVPLLLPDTVSTAFRWQFRLWLARSVVVAREIICVSEVGRQSLLEHFAVDPAKVSVIHHGLDHVARLGQPDAITVKWLDALGLPERWALYAGALDARKNVELALTACEQLFDAGQPVTLVLAGQRWFGASAIERQVLRLKARGLDIRVLGYLETSVFYALMRRASLFVFPSRYEGFGFPPLEAMALGVPAIVSNAGSLPEVCGDAALKIDPDDAQGLAEAMSRLLNDEDFRVSQARLGLQFTARYRWADTARATAAIHARAAD